ncbi:efflux RND transporter periplasmic adaptor subunit [Endozoicomonas sp. Mp262]|uniref:efflux RND transporter periplasmic adaptor subunit n=1 Tax=Endozoicomonas sp. Mp262 TaxID=2919499 RepID=UPI0021D8514E
MANGLVVRQITVSLSILLLSAGLFFGLSQLKGSPEKEESPLVAPFVEVRQLSPESVNLVINSQGVVHPAIETRLVTEASGVVKAVSPVFVSGAVFNKGDVLATIDDSDYQVALRQAEAGLAASKAKLAEEVARSEAEKKNWQRSGRNLADAPELLLRKPYVAEARANVKAASAQLAKARRDLEKTVIKAPYEGMVRERSINIGQYVSPGTEAGTLFSVDYSEVRLPIKPTDLEFVDLPAIDRHPFNNVKVTLEQRLGQRTLSWDARVARAEGIVDERSRMHYLVVRVDDPYGLKTPREMPLKAGSFIYARLQGRTMDNLFRLPRSALYGSGQVMVLNRQQNSRFTLHFRDITIIYATESDVFVRGNLRAGEWVSLTALSNPVEGMQVKSSVTRDIAKDEQQMINLSNR